MLFPLHICFYGYLCILLHSFINPDQYAPLNFLNPLLAMPTGDYLKYMPKFIGEGYFIAEEHLEEFYSYAESINIE